MMHVDIMRDLMDKTGTISTISVTNDEGDAKVFYGIERPWLENRPLVSCIPTGDYVLEPHDSAKFRDTWAFVGGSVSHWPHEGNVRNACLIHVANWSHQVQGCLGLGLSHGLDDRGFMVKNSRDAMGQLRSFLDKDTTYTCKIRAFA